MKDYIKFPPENENEEWKFFYIWHPQNQNQMELDKLITWLLSR